MNYFSFFGFTEQLDIDLSLLKKTFYANSKKFHPDYYTLASEEIQIEALEKSTYNNEGYKVLQNFDSRLKYFLEINNQLAEEGQNQIPQDFLMEMMEFNEKLMELEFDFDEKVHQELVNNLNEIKDHLTHKISNLISLTSDKIEEDGWRTLLETYFKNQYIKRIQRNLESMIK